MSGTSHPRLQAPIHHVAGDIRMKPGEQRITVRAGDVLLADSSRAVLVLEGRHPVRQNLPPEDVRRELLAPSYEDTYCPYKGSAVHYALASGGSIAWSYPTPLPGMEPIAELIAFYQERVSVVVEPI